MSDAINKALSTVFALIEADKLSEARDVLEPLLETEKDNADVWWLYAHSVEDSEMARTALQNVLRLKPSYPGATDLMQALEQKKQVAETVREAAVSPDEMLGLDEDELDLDFEDLDEDFEAKIGRPSSRRRLLLRFGGVVVFLVILVVAVFLISSLGGEETTTPTRAPTAAVQSGATNTPQPSLPPPTTPTVVVTRTPEEEYEFQTVLEALARHELAERTLERAETDLGVTLLAPVCVAGAVSPRDILNDAMTAMARVSPTIAADIEAVGVRLLDCATEDVFNVIAVSRSYAEAYSQGTLAEVEFRGFWRAVG